MVPPLPGQDWTDGEAYAPLLKVDRSGFAWEWLRRNAAYREAAVEALQNSGAQGAAADERAARWGLHAFEAPDRAAPDARPMWRRPQYPYVLPATTVPACDVRDEFDVRRLWPLAATVRAADGSEHLLLSDGYSSIRLDVIGGGVSGGGRKLRYHLEGFVGLEPELLTLRRLLALWRKGRFSRSLHPPERRAGRWVAMLRTWDALAVGSSHREIAARLLSREVERPRWRVEVPTTRSRVQRLVRSAQMMGEGGYLELLKDPA